MILDSRNQPIESWWNAAIVDANTGENLTERLPIFHADDSKGECRVYEHDRDEAGNVTIREPAAGGGEIPWYIRSGPIRIVPGEPITR